MKSSGLLTIDLAAICRNWEIIKQQAKSGVEAGAVVKANAYGLGALQVAHALYGAGCRSFFLATKEEALGLQSFLPADARLFLLGVVRPGDEAQVSQSGLIPVLYSLESILRWHQVCADYRQKFPCVIKLDTGMTRLGLALHELPVVLASRPDFPLLNPVMFMSHLACSEQTDHPLNHLQLSRFQDAVVQIKTEFPDAVLSLANSSGVFLGEAWHFDLLRPGAALYGVNPTPGKINPMHSVLTLELPVIQVRELLESATVGYGATIQVSSNTKLAVVAGGYADGLNRVLGSAPTGFYRGAELKALGRISMDTMVFDATATAIAAGDYLEVINRQLTIELLMQRTGGLGYEVLTSLGARLNRIYKE